MFILTSLFVIRRVESVTCIYRNASLAYFCDLVNQVVESENDLQVVHGDHIEGFDDSMVTQINTARSKITIFPSLLIEHFPNLVIANLARTQMKSFPRQIRTCNHLVNVNLRNNMLTNIPSGIFINCLVLRTLSFGGIIRHIDENSFVGLTSLRTLDLVLCNITTIHQNAFSTLNSLEVLYLDVNQIGDLHPDLFLHNSRLWLLGATHNLLSTIPEGMFRNNFALRTIILENNFLKSTSAFHNLPALRQLSLESNLFEDISPLESLPLLEFLSFRNNPIRNIRAGSFSSVPSLQILNLNNLLITSIQDQTFQNLNNLTSLMLAANQISEVGPNTFTGLTSLTSLTLSHNMLEELNAPSFATMRSLSHFDAEHNRIKRIDRELFNVLPMLVSIRLFGNICADESFWINPNNRIIPDLRDCFGSAIANKINVLVLAVLVFVSIMNSLV